MALPRLAVLLLMQAGGHLAAAFHVTVGFFGIDFFNALARVLDSPTSPKRLRILEVGSQDVNGGLRTYAPLHWDYVGVDLAPGPGVDHVLADAYHYPFEAESFDAVVSTSAFEHMNFFWLSFLEMLRVTRRDGYVFITAPSNVRYHGDMVPPDSWRFFGDAGSSLEAWGHMSGYPGLRRLEGFVHPSVEYQRHEDNVMIFDLAGEEAQAPGRPLLGVARVAPASHEVAMDYLSSHHQCWRQLSPEQQAERFMLPGLPGSVGFGYACCTLTELAGQFGNKQAREQVLSLRCWGVQSNRSYQSCCPFVMTD